MKIIMLPKTAIIFKNKIDACEKGDENAEKFLRKDLMPIIWDTMPKDILILMCRFLYDLENQAGKN